MWLPAATFVVVVVILRGVQPASTFQRWVFGLGLEYILIYVYTAKLYTNGYTIPSHTCIGSIPSRGAIFLLDRRQK